MKLVSINVARPVEVAHEGRTVRTAIFKSPVAGPVAVRRLNLEGDGQADLDNHGGEHMAVYAYALEHYAYWRNVLAREDMPHGLFGENLTVAGLDESASRIGDRLAIGSALFAITQPRIPCYKLGIRVGNAHMPRLFSDSARTGCYLRVLREGFVTAGDAVELAGRGRSPVTVRALFVAWMKPEDQVSARTLAQALEAEDLSPEWRAKIERRLRRGPGGPG
jgi:MOSC domain-containing protein YiiM